MRRLLYLLVFALTLASAHAQAQATQVIAWGSNTHGQATVPTGLTDAVAVEGGGFVSLAIRADGTVVAWGLSGFGQTAVPAGLSDVVAVDAGYAHALALRSDGTVVAWGFNDSGQLDVPAGLTDAVAVVAGDFHNLAVKSDGTVVGWGRNTDGQITIPVDLTDVVAVGAGGFHSLALKADGTVVAWGQNHAGQTSVPAGLSDVVRIAAGFRHSAALRADGTVVTWGNIANAPAGLSDAVAIASGPGSVHSLALKADGTVVAWGGNSDGQLNVPAGLTDAIGIGTGIFHSLALRTLPFALEVEPLDGRNGNPVGAPLNLPSGVGTVYYRGTATNDDNAALITEVWSSVELPSGAVVTENSANTVRIKANGSRFFPRTLNVASSLPSGTYTVTQYLGTYPDGALAAASFAVEKAVARRGAPTLTEEEIAGMDFDELFGFENTVSVDTTPDGELPTETVLGSAYPNPFNLTATVPFTLAQDGDVRLAVYDLLGREVAVLVQGPMRAGSHTAVFDAGQLASGTYLVRFAAFPASAGTGSRHVQTQRLTLLK